VLVFLSSTSVGVSSVVSQSNHHIKESIIDSFNMVITKFLKKTVLMSAGATVVALASFLFVFFPFSASADTVYGSGGEAGFELIDFGCSGVNCQAEQHYLSRSEDIAPYTSFNSMQVRASTTEDVLRFFVFEYDDRGISRFLCEDMECVADDQQIGLGVGSTALGIPVAMNRVSGTDIFQASFAEYTFSSSTNAYLNISLVPQVPYTPIYVARSIDGLSENGYNLSRRENGFAYQICTDTCNPFGDFIPSISAPLADQITNYDTRFTGGSVSGPTTAIVFDISYFLDTTEYNGSGEPNLISIGVVKDSAFSDEIYDTLQKNIQSYVSGASSVTVEATDNYVNGGYYAFVIFRNQSTGESQTEPIPEL